MFNQEVIIPVIIPGYIYISKADELEFSNNIKFLVKDKENRIEVY